MPNKLNETDDYNIDDYDVSILDLDGPSPDELGDPTYYVVDDDMDWDEWVASMLSYQEVEDDDTY